MITNWGLQATTHPCIAVQVKCYSLPALTTHISLLSYTVATCTTTTHLLLLNYTVALPPDILYKIIGSIIENSGTMMASTDNYKFVTIDDDEVQAQMV